jgi:hypothetical protein
MISYEHTDVRRVGGQYIKRESGGKPTRPWQGMSASVDALSYNVSYVGEKLARMRRMVIWLTMDFQQKKRGVGVNKSYMCAHKAYSPRNGRPVHIPPLQNAKASGKLTTLHLWPRTGVVTGQLPSVGTS